MKVPALNWSHNLNCSFGNFSEIHIPSIIKLSAGKRVILITLEKKDIPLKMICRNNPIRSDAFQVLPIANNESFNFTYYAMSYGHLTSSINADSSLTTIVGLYPLTTVTITTHNESIYMEDSNTLLKPLDTITKIIQRGQSLALSVNQSDLTGVKVETNYPVRFLSGHECSDVPSTLESCDQLAEEIPPVEYWGREFVAVPIAERKAYDILRIMAAFDNTTVTFNCTNGSSALTIMMSGQFKDFTLNSSVSCGITTTKKSLVVQYSVGNKADKGFFDPFMVLVPPVSWYSDENLFYSFEDYEHSYINVVILQEHLMEESLAIILDNQIVNLNLTLGQFRVQNNNMKFSCYQLPVSNGSHHLYLKDKEAKIGVTVYGAKTTSSYGYASLSTG